MPRVFISYSHDSEPHKERVKALAMRLKNDGVDVVIDQDTGAGGPPEGWPRWSQRQVEEADRVLLACTSGYCARYDSKGPPDTGRGVVCEATVIRNELYNSKFATEKYRPVMFAGTGEKDVPVSIQHLHRFRAEEDYRDLLQWLTGSIAVAASGAAALSPAWPAPLAGLRPLLADRKEEFEIFEQMITGQSRERILLLQGASGSGKTTLATELCKYARKLHALVGNADLKGCPTQAATLSVLTMRLGSFGTSSSLDALLAGLRTSDRPVLLALDTYEAASEEMAQWTERCLQLLDELPYVVAMVSGQNVPDARKSSWRSLACPRQLRPIDDVSDWVRYAREAWPGVTFDEKHIESLVFGTGGNPALLGTLLPNMMDRLSRSAGGAL